MLPTIARENDVVVMIDQRKLPSQEVYVRCRTAAEVAKAIRKMVIITTAGSQTRLIRAGINQVPARNPSAPVMATNRDEPAHPARRHHAMN